MNLKLFAGYYFNDSVLLNICIYSSNYFDFIGCKYNNCSKIGHRAEVYRTLPAIEAIPKPRIAYDNLTEQKSYGEATMSSSSTSSRSSASNSSSNGSSTSSIVPGSAVRASAIVKAPVVVATSAKVAVPEIAVKGSVGGGGRGGGMARSKRK